MADDWFWQPDRLPETRAVVPYTPMPALPSTPILPQMNLADLDAGFQLAVQALHALLATTGLATGAVLYDPRLEVIRAYFITCSRGEIAMPVLVMAVRAELLGMGDEPVAAILGFELAKAGFLSMGRPQLAAPFGREAARGRRYLRDIAQAQHAQLEEHTHATDHFDWHDRPDHGVSAPS